MSQAYKVIIRVKPTNDGTVLTYKNSIGKDVQIKLNAEGKPATFIDRLNSRMLREELESGALKKRC